MTRLAIDGGTPVIVESDYRAWPDYTDKDEQAVLGVMRDGRIGRETAVIRDFELEVAAYFGRRYALGMPTGTAACIAALVGAGVGPGDEVIVPAFTFSATAQAVTMVGARPVFVDVVPETWSLDYEQAEGLITDRTRAIFAVHMDGIPADMGAARRVHRERGVPTVEDAAHAAGATLGGVRAGNFGITAAFSMHKEKVLTAMAGGIVLGDDDEVFEAINRFSNFGEDRRQLGWGEERSYEVKSKGENLRIHPAAAAIGRAQLGYGDGSRPARLDRYLETARRNAAILDEGLRAVPGWSPPVVPAGCESSYCHYRAILHPEAHGWDGDPGEYRDRVLAAAFGEGSFVAWQRRPLPAMPGFRRGDDYPAYAPGRDLPPLRAWQREKYPVALDVCARSVVICRGKHMLHVQTEELMYKIIEAVMKVHDNIDRVLSGPYVPPKIVPPFTADL